jgi:hypothetical protein
MFHIYHSKIFCLFLNLIFIASSRSRFMHINSYFVSTITFLSLIHSVFGTSVPNDTRINLVRTRHMVQIDGHILRPSVVTASDRIESRTWLRYTNCGNVNSENGLVFFAPSSSSSSSNILLDVSDMLRGGAWLWGLCLSYQSALSRSMNSVLYLAHPETDSGPALILEPLNVSQYAQDGIISYAHVFHEGKIRARVGFESPEQLSSTHEVIVNPFDDSAVSVPLDQLQNIVNIIESIEGLTIEGWNIDGSKEVRGHDCYNLLVTSLPNLHIGLVSEDGHQVVADLIFSPDDYVSQSTRINEQCWIHLYSPRRYIGHLVLTDLLLRKLGGFHFDYANNRIGFFD